LESRSQSLEALAASLRYQAFNTGNPGLQNQLFLAADTREVRVQPVVP